MAHFLGKRHASHTLTIACPQIGMDSLIIRVGLEFIVSRFYAPCNVFLEWAVSVGSLESGAWTYDSVNRNSTLNWLNLTAQTFEATVMLDNTTHLEHNTTYFSTIIGYNRGVSSFLLCFLQ
jgi:hypothetical protein